MNQTMPAMPSSQKAMERVALRSWAAAISAGRERVSNGMAGI
jgi:hypothetical protein